MNRMIWTVQGERSRRSTESKIQSIKSLAMTLGAGAHLEGIADEIETLFRT